jgi:hypothetical protein
MHLENKVVHFNSVGHGFGDWDSVVQKRRLWLYGPTEVIATDFAKVAT